VKCLINEPSRGINPLADKEDLEPLKPTVLVMTFQIEQLQQPAGLAAQETSAVPVACLYLSFSLSLPTCPYRPPTILPPTSPPPIPPTPPALISHPIKSNYSKDHERAKPSLATSLNRHATIAFYLPLVGRGGVGTAVTVGGAVVVTVTVTPGGGVEQALAALITPSTFCNQF
jgi:hypothetical protein